MSTASKLATGIIGTTLALGGGTVAVDNSINPYTQKGTALEIAATSTLPEAGAVKTVVDTDTPRIELDKWNGEVKLGITSLDIPAKTTGSRPLLSKNVEWGTSAMPGVFGGTSAISMEAVPIDATTTMEDGGMEININLTSEPASNVFTFQLDNYADLDFFYQAPLWQEAGLKAPTADCTDTSCNTDGEGTSTRPENVVGSYAVYYKDHANHVEGQTNYATGKAYQIFRPQVSDANGNTTWAELAYSNGMLTVSVPQDFLDSAAYPVKVDPTFGYTTAGGTETDQATTLTPVSGQLTASYAASSGDTLTKISIYTKCVAGTGSAVALNAAVFTYSAGLPVSQQAATKKAITETGTTAGWIDTSTMSFSLTGGTSYISAFGMKAQSGGCSTDQLATFRDVLSGNQRSVNSTTGDLPASWVDGGQSASSYSIYATYTASGGGTVPTKNVILNGGTMRLSGGTMQI